MKKSIIFMILLGAMIMSMCGSVAAADSLNTAQLPNNREIFVDVANDNGVRYNLDTSVYNGPNNTYYIKAGGGGTNALHVTNNASIVNGQVTVKNATSTSSSGVFYLTDTGGRGYNDDIILLLSVKGPISDNFALNIVSSGYSWTPSSSPSGYQYVTGINETFTISDFKYGPHVYKPGPGALGTWSLPLYYGQNTSDPSTAEYLMFIDLYAGTLKGTNYPNLIDNGAVKVEYNFTNLYTTASFNMYGWCQGSNQAQGINWVNPTTGAGASGYTVNYAPITPVGEFSSDITSGTAPLTVKFTDQSANYPTSWAWDFNNDGIIDSTQQNPTFTYTTPGTYTVTLNATNLAGSNSIVKTDYITVSYPAPVADFSAGTTNGSSPLDVYFSDKSAGYITSYAWDFNSDGIIDSTEQNPTYSYSTSGTYTVTLTVSGPGGSNSVVKTDYITVLNSDVFVQITPSKTNPQVGDKVTYTFKLGNNGPGIAKNVVFTYVIPEGLEFAGANVDQGDWTYDSATRTLTWNVGDAIVKPDPYLWLDLNVLSAGTFDINPLVTVSGNNIGSEGNVDSLLVTATSVPVEPPVDTPTDPVDNSTTETPSSTLVNAQSESVPMQNTGAPLAGLAMALLLVGSGLALGRRK